MAETKLTVRILMLENSPSDVKYIQQLLIQENNNLEFFCAVDKKSCLEGIINFAPDIILFENCIPQFSAAEALQLLQKARVNIPFILVTGILSEAEAIDLVKQGADDYILKKSMARLPLAVEAAIKHRNTAKEAGNLKYALNQAAIISVMDQAGLITDVNEHFCNMSGFTASELIGKPHQLYNSGRYSKIYFSQLWAILREGKVWKGELHGKGNLGTEFWVDTTIVPFLDNKNQPCQYIAISKDITARKKLQAKILNQQKDQKLKIAATALEAQEKERNHIGQELHDNINQILVGIKILLAAMMKGQRTGAEFLKMCYENIGVAIEENRKIARILITPAFAEDNLLEQLIRLFDSMLAITGLTIHKDTHGFNEVLLSRDQKLAIYRVAQEQCTNIVKYAAAKNVFISISTLQGVFNMTIEDDGIGIKDPQVAKGVGLRNIAFRMAAFNGSSHTSSLPGVGFTLKIEIPLKKEKSKAFNLKE